MPPHGEALKRSPASPECLSASFPVCSRTGLCQQRQQLRSLLGTSRPSRPGVASLFHCQELSHRRFPEGTSGNRMSPSDCCVCCTSTLPLSLTASCNMRCRCNWGSAHDSYSHDHRDPRQKPLEELHLSRYPLFHTQSRQKDERTSTIMDHCSLICVTGTAKSFTDVSRNPGGHGGRAACAWAGRHPTSSRSRATKSGRIGTPQPCSHDHIDSGGYSVARYRRATETGVRRLRGPTRCRRDNVP